MNSSASEALCRKCGRCCYVWARCDGRITKTRLPCGFFDPVTKLCRVYEHRFELNPECLSVPEAIEQRVLPGDCPYVADLEGYEPREGG